MEQIIYKKEENKVFIKELHQRVNQYFNSNSISKKGNYLSYTKAIFFFGIIFTSYSAIWFSDTLFSLFLAYGLSGVFSIFLALNVAHDAAHDTFSNNKKINNLFLYTFDLLGASGYMWKLKHVHSHHVHVNIPAMDADISQGKIIRLFNKSVFWSIHKYQHIYMPFIYLFYTLNWLLYRDFKDHFQNCVSGKPNLIHSKKSLLILFAGKILYIFFWIILPMILIPFSWYQFILGFIFMQFCASITVTTVLASAHVGEFAQFPEPNKKGEMPYSWALHQILTTTDFATSNPFITHLYGGFNHHVVHHLFPSINHIHYPVLTDILKNTCDEYDVPYQRNPSLWSAIKSHWNLLRIRSKNNIPPQILEI